MRIVYDCSTRANPQSPFLNDCLETGPPLQPLLFDILLRNRMRKFCVTGDVQKAFLQIRLHNQDRDAQQVLWYDNLRNRKVTEYRFTRVIFGATSSPYILGATLQKHVRNYEADYPTTVRSLLEDTYVDDIQGGGDTVEEAAIFKEESTKVLSEGRFFLHKWHSNVEHLTSGEGSHEEESCAKSLLGNRQSSGTKILGTKWNKKEDTFTINFESCLKTGKPLTKRKMISTLNSIYDVLGLSAPATSALPTFRTEFTEPFHATGVDFAGPLLYKSGKHETSKAYVALFTCASTRAVHLRLCKDLTAGEFRRGLKEFLARKGSPNLMVSDNAKTFQATKQWLSTLRKDEDLFNYLATRDIEWKFNLSRAPWWGRFFERLIGVMKKSLSKAIGRALLKFEELGDTLLDVETFMKNRPLCYLREDFEQPVITPNLLLHGQPARFLEEDTVDASDEREKMTRRLPYLKACREHVRKRWLNEYLRALQERFNTGPAAKEQMMMNKGSLVLIKDMTKNRANWRIGRIVDSIIGKDGVTRGYKIRTGKGYVVERPLQLIADLEISGDSDDPNKSVDDAGGDNTSQDQSAMCRPARQAKIAAVNREDFRLIFRRLEVVHSLTLLLPLIKQMGEGGGSKRVTSSRLKIRLQGLRQQKHCETSCCVPVCYTWQFLVQLASQQNYHADSDKV